MKGLPPILVFLVALTNWSDGTPAGQHHNDTGAVWRREQPCASATFCSPRAAASGHNTVCIPLVLAGRAKAQMDDSIAAAIDKKELPAMESGAMSYMMSKQGYAGDSAPDWPPHLMFFYSETDPAIWGANLPGYPVFAVADPRNN